MQIKLNYKNLLIDDIYYGGDQDWYSTYRKRLSGCGPTTASTITMYELRKDKSIFFSKEDFKRLMNNMWNYITPGLMGVNKSTIYINGYNKYIKSNHINLKDYKHLHIDRNTFYSYEEVFNFLKDSLEKDHPIAFLNLDNGNEKQLESWHWVTIVGISYDKDVLIATICDEGYLKDINLDLWLKTTSYGDFIYYY